MLKQLIFLNHEIGKKYEKIEWIGVRPDTLIDEEKESSYEISPHRVRSPIFNAGKTSRINVSHFMVELTTNEKLWNKWLFKTPVLYNQSKEKWYND